MRTMAWHCWQESNLHNTASKAGTYPLGYSSVVPSEGLEPPWDPLEEGRLSARLRRLGTTGRNRTYVKFFRKELPVP